MTVLAHPFLAVAIGACMLCGETCMHFGDIMAARSWVDLPVHDWLSGGLLVFGGLAARRDWSRGRVIQIAGWAFMTSLLLGAFVGHWEEWRTAGTQGDEWFSAGAFLTIIAVFLVVSAGSLIATVTGARASQP